jgi:hypothetical protein
MPQMSSLSMYNPLFPDRLFPVWITRKNLKNPFVLIDQVAIDNGALIASSFL